MQMQALKKYAKQRQWKVVMEIEETGSGTNHRPQRESLLKAARRREIDNIIVWRLDRWDRSITSSVAIPLDMQPPLIYTLMQMVIRQTT